MSSSSSTTVPEIPGHYWDPERNRYFRITRDHPIPSSCINPSSNALTSLKKKKPRNTFKNLDSGPSLRSHWRLPSPFSLEDKNSSFSQQLRSRAFNPIQPRYTERILYTKFLNSRKRKCLQYPMPFQNHPPLLALDSSSNTLYYATNNEVCTQPLKHVGSIYNIQRKFSNLPSPPTSLHITKSQDVLMTLLGSESNHGAFYFNNHSFTLSRQSCWTSTYLDTSVIVGCSRRLYFIDLTLLKLSKPSFIPSDPLALQYLQPSICIVGYRDGSSALFDLRSSTSRSSWTWTSLSHHVSVNGFVNEGHTTYLHARDGSIGLVQPGYPLLHLHSTPSSSQSACFDALGFTSIEHLGWVLAQPNQQPWVHVYQRHIVDTDPCPTVNSMVYAEHVGMIGAHSQGLVMAKWPSYST